MKLYDDVRVLCNTKYYNQNAVFKGMIGTIIHPEIRDNRFYVCFIDEKLSDKNFIFNDKSMQNLKDDIFLDIEISDLELVKEGFGTDERILEELPKQNPKWWCKVEDGYIVNLLGEKKNKIPYNYNS